MKFKMRAKARRLEFRMIKQIQQADDYFLSTYSRYPIILDKGDGIYLYDVTGKQYLDFGSGIGVFSLGYHNETYNNALKEQIDKLIHTSNYYYNDPAIKAAQKFLNASHMDKVFFTNSGTEAVEGAIKLARKYYYQKKHSSDSEIIAMQQSFHGRSLGSLSVTGNETYREGFFPYNKDVHFAEFNNMESVKSFVNDKTCAIILEPIQGEGGIYPAEKKFLQDIRKLCDDNDILLIFDEIQCGMGRTGTMFAYEWYGVLPDIMASAKALGGGVPVGAFGAVKKAADAFGKGDHGSTYGGNPLACAAINIVFDIMEESDILNHVKEISAYLEKKLEELVREYDIVKTRRGIGLLQGIELSVPPKDILSKAMELGLILYGAGNNTIRFIPPFIIEKEDIDQMIVILKECL